MKLNISGDYMIQNIIGGAVTATVGVFIAVINYLFSKKALTKVPDKYFLTTVTRQFIQVAFLVTVYFIGTKTQIADTVFLLVGAVLGMTVPMIYFTKKLLSLNEAVKPKEKESEQDG